MAFVDAGEVSAGKGSGTGNLSTGNLSTGNFGVGAGLGARYYTAIGPIRLDFAIPLSKQPGGDSFELYFGIGHAF